MSDVLRHWWRELPEAGTNRKVDEIERLMREESELRARLRDVRGRIQDLDERVSEDAVRLWGREVAHDTRDTTEQPEYLWILPECLTHRRK